MDRPFGPRVVVSPLRAMNIKSALRDWLYESYSMKSILVIGSLRSPPLSGCAGLPPQFGRSIERKALLWAD